MAKDWTVDAENYFQAVDEMHDAEYKVPKATFEYHAKNGEVFTKEAYWYEAQETLNELSASAYSAGTELDYVIIK